MQRLSDRCARSGGGRLLVLAAAATVAIAAVVLSTTLSGQQRPAVTSASAPSPFATSPAPGLASGSLSPARSPRNASYTIRARLTPSTRQLTGSSVITWRNISSSPTQELRFHTYWNAFRDMRSTFLRERARAGGPTYSADDFATLAITRLAVDDRAIPPPLEFVAPDDGNRDDATVLRVALPVAVAPGESVRIALDWTARVPRPIARTGVIGDFYFIAQWFPKIGVLEDTGWNCHQFHATTEFFADFGTYDVALTVPAGWPVGATGSRLSETVNADGTTTHRFYQEDVHDFAWTTSPALVERLGEYAPADGPPGQRPVRIRVLMQPERAAQADRHIAATEAALRWFTQWAGPYPYEQITVVDPAFQSEAAGMEYPTLITAGSPWWIGRDVTIATPEEVVLHETGHQFFYGMVASNEFEDAWMDEGITTYLTGRALVQDYPHSFYERRLFGGFVPWVVRDLEVSRERYWNRYNGYRRTPNRDVPSTPSFRYSVTSGPIVTYGKTALWLNTLERQLGWPVMQRVLQTYFARWQFRHPKPADFFAVVNEVSGQDMTWFFDQVYRSSNTFDYAIDALRSTRTAAGYRSDVTVGRRGEAIFPVDVEIAFANGERRIEHWDGRERWTQFSIDGPARAVSAEVDPRQILLLDVNRTNNSRAVSGASDTAATRWSLRWLVWLQDQLLTWAFFV